MWATPEKHTKKRETLRNANQSQEQNHKKGWVQEGVWTPPPPSHPSPRKHSELKEPYEMLNKTKITNNNS